MELSLRHKQQLQMSQMLQTSLHVLQLSVLELADFIRLEASQNPLLLCEENRETVQFNPDFLCYRPSLFEHLMQQACNTFSGADLISAEFLIGNLDERGFYTEPLHKEHEKTLKIIQTFDPIGIGAKNLQESLLIQLRAKGSKESSYQFIEKEFDALLHKKVTPPKQILQELLLLSLNPASRFSNSCAPPITPDVILCNDEESWHVTINDTPLPHISLLESEQQIEKKILSHYRQVGKELQNAIEHRTSTLHKLTLYLLQTQAPFFLEGGPLLPLTMQETARALNLHESSITRAVAHKHLALPHKTVAFRSLFSTPFSNNNLSSNAIHEELFRWIKSENKKSPFSDQELCLKLEKQGIICSRRTIAKYRTQLKIPKASLRI